MHDILRIFKATVFAIAACTLLAGCQSTEVTQQPVFNAYPVKADDQGELYRHELLAPEGFGRDDAIRLIQYCAARLAAERGYSSILFQDSAVVDRESGWEVPRLRVRINARYANATVAQGAGAAAVASQLLVDLRRSSAAIDSFCVQVGPG